MISPFVIYWISQLDSVIKVSAALGIILSLAMVFCCIGYIVMRLEGDYSELLDKLRYKLFLLACPFVLIATFLPSSKTLAAMYIVPAIANNEKVKDVGDRLYGLAVEWLDDLKPKKKNVGSSESEVRK